MREHAPHLVAAMLLQWLFGGDDDESPLGLVGTIAAMLVAPIAAMLLQFAISRSASSSRTRLRPSCW